MRLNFNLSPEDVERIRYSAKDRYNQLIRNFVASGKDCAEVVLEEDLRPLSVSASIKNAAKRLGFNDIGTMTSGRKVFILKQN